MLEFLIPFSLGVISTITVWIATVIDKKVEQC